MPKWWSERQKVGGLSEMGDLIGRCLYNPIIASLETHICGHMVVSFVKMGRTLLR